MFMLIRRPDGSVRKGIVLARTRTWMRVAVVGVSDTLELRLCGPHWCDESGEPVPFVFTNLAGSGTAANWLRLQQAAVRPPCRRRNNVVELGNRATTCEARKRSDTRNRYFCAALV